MDILRVLNIKEHFKKVLREFVITGLLRVLNYLYLHFINNLHRIPIAFEKNF